MDYDDLDSPSTSSASPNYSPADYQSEFPPSPGQLSYTPDSNLPSHLPESYPVESHNNYGATTGSLNFSASQLSRGNSMFPSNGAVPRPSSVNHTSGRDSCYRETSSPLSSASFTLPLGISPQDQRKSGFVPNPPKYMSNALSNTNISPSYTRYSPNKITSVCLLAEGMTPFTIKLDALLPPSQAASPIALKARLCISSVDDARSPPMLHGFIGSVCLGNVWTSSGKCTTKVFSGNVCISEETGPLDVTNVDVGTVIAMFPESSLTRCRWLDACEFIVLVFACCPHDEPSLAVQTSITQEIMIDNEILLYLIYDLDRKNGGGLPSAELLGYQNSRTVEKPSAPQQIPRYNSYPAPSMTHSSYPTTQTMSCARRATQTSLSCALTPVNNIRHHTMPTSMSF